MDCWPTVPWFTSGYWVDEWFPQMMIFFTSLIFTPNLPATYNTQKHGAGFLGNCPSQGYQYGCLWSIKYFLSPSLVKSWHMTHDPSADNARSQPITPVWWTNFKMERFSSIYWWGNLETWIDLDIHCIKWNFIEYDRVQKTFFCLPVPWLCSCLAGSGKKSLLQGCWGHASGRSDSWCSQDSPPQAPEVSHKDNENSVRLISMFHGKTNFCLGLGKITKKYIIEWRSDDATTIIFLK